MSNQAGRGWYDVGDGMAAMWDGQQWTGERISHEQLRAMTQPPPPPPPAPAGAPGRGVKPWQWIAGLVAVIAAIPIFAALAPPSTTTSQRARSTTTTVSAATVFRDTAAALAKVCDSADSSRNGMTIAVASNDQDCQELVGLSLGLIGFTSADYTAAVAGHPVLSEGGGAELTVIVAADGEVITVRKVA